MSELLERATKDLRMGGHNTRTRDQMNADFKVIAELLEKGWKWDDIHQYIEEIRTYKISLKSLIYGYKTTVEKIAIRLDQEWSVDRLIASHSEIIDLAKTEFYKSREDEVISKHETSIGDAKEFSGGTGITVKNSETVKAKPGDPRFLKIMSDGLNNIKDLVAPGEPETVQLQTIINMISVEDNQANLPPIKSEKEALEFGEFIDFDDVEKS